MKKYKKANIRPFAILVFDKTIYYDETLISKEQVMNKIFDNP